MVIKNLLLAQEAGLGNGETPIFPILIFKVKEGVNYNPEDPNYDLLQLSYRVTAKRLFPNYTFLDAPFNLQYYKKGHPETEISTMGCIEGSEQVTYKIGDKLYVESIYRMFNRVSALSNVVNYGISEYIDTDGLVQIFDRLTNGFVNCKKVIRNPNRNNWVRIKFSNGRLLTCTLDHPLPVIRRDDNSMFTQRIYAKDLRLGDKAISYYDQYSEETILMNTDIAWLLGLIICDGCYRYNSVAISLGSDESDIINKVISVTNKHFPNASIKLNDRRLDRNQNYIDVIINFNDNNETINKFINLFEGINKVDRHVPNEVFSWDRNAKLAFLSGMIDADGYNHKTKSNKACYIQIGSTNKELAYGQLSLAQALGFSAKVYENHYTSKHPEKIRYAVSFSTGVELYDYMSSQKKILPQTGCNFKIGFAEIVEIMPVDINDYSYDVETSSDMFAVSGIQSHNCRTRVMGNVYDPENEIAYGRGNLSFTTLNLPMLALMADGDEEKFYKLLDKYLELAKKQLLERFELQAKIKVKNMKFLMGQHIWIGSDKLGPEDEIREVIKHGSMTIGFVGLAETLVALYGHHHGEGKEYWDKGYAIIKHMREYTDKISEEMKLNFGVLATPAEGYAGKALRQCRKKFGIIKGVTDREYFTNSNHIPVYFDIDAAEKIKLEAPFHELCNGGHICYVELDGDLTKNTEAIASIVKLMHDYGVGYGSINHPVDTDPVCGYTGIINDECPNCHRHETDDQPNFERIRRITG